MTNLPDATWTEVDRAQRRALLVPLGSLEQHGPHLPLDTDTRIAVAVAGGAAAGREGVAVAPPVTFGSSGEHAGFAGTLSIGANALTELLIELGRDAARDWESLLLVNAHGGNLDAVSRALARLNDEGRRCDAFHAGVASGDAHAGRTETAVMLQLDPGAVRLGLAEPGETRAIGELMDRLRQDGVLSVSANGVLGDPRAATAEEGRLLLGELVQGCSGALDALLDRVAAHA
ncbi:MAG TPA: mycofactocin biosynthesis peptidyl-dipeptidase MftE [Solirubrobacteraceae bacterium]|nr:mycofactocin biosynthesis peptidyl-dipeptidase MftE [Solirubrobacteraceae bacterium]